MNLVYHFAVLNNDSFFRYSLFSLSAVHFSTVERVKNPVSVFKAALVVYVKCAVEMPEKYLGKVVTRNDLEEIGGKLFLGFIKSWGEFSKLSSSGQMNEAVRKMCAMLHSTESPSEFNEADYYRLSPLANWIFTTFGDMAEAFDKFKF